MKLNARFLPPKIMLISLPHYYNIIIIRGKSCEYFFLIIDSASLTYFRFSVLGGSLNIIVRKHHMI